MTLRPPLAIVAVVAIILIARSGRLPWIAHAEEARPPAAAPTTTHGDRLRFEPGAAQLAFVTVQPVNAAPAPLVEALPARIVADPDRTARIVAPVAGRIVRIDVAPGTQVRRGQPLATLDAPEYAQAVADVERTGVDLAQKTRTLERVTVLHDGGVLPDKDLEAARTDVAQARVEVGRARAQRAALGAGEGGGPLVLRAPLDGVIVERNANPGTRASPDDPKPLFVVSDPTRLQLVVDVPEREVADFVPGGEVAIALDAFPDRTVTGHVETVGDIVDPDTRRVPVRVRVDVPDRTMKLGMFARVAPLAAGGTPRVKVPVGALVTVGSHAWVFVERAPGEFERRAVTVAVQGHESAWLADGIPDGARVVVSGALLLEAELQGH